VNIGYIQFAPVLGDLEATLGVLESLMEKARRADLLVLPELCNSGYHFRSKKEASASAEVVGDGPFSRFLEAKCREYNTHIVSGMNERSGSRLYNASILVGPGGILGTYRKLHLFKDEKDFFTPGDLGLPVFRVGPTGIGMLVCFDWIFPEAWRVLALKGADIICHPSNLVLPGLAQRAVPVHAMINRVFIITANRIGAEGELTFTGGSLVSDPAGEVLVEGPPKGEHVGVVSVNPGQARDKKVTERNDIFEDRRPEDYVLLGSTETRTGAAF
jgi:predicted amidohydrolase